MIGCTNGSLFSVLAPEVLSLPAGMGPLVAGADAPSHAGRTIKDALPSGMGFEWPLLESVHGDGITLLFCPVNCGMAGACPSLLPSPVIEFCELRRNLILVRCG